MPGWVLNVSLTGRTIPTYSFLFIYNLVFYSLHFVPPQFWSAFGLSCGSLCKCRIKTFKSLVRRHIICISLTKISPHEVPASAVPEDSQAPLGSLANWEVSRFGFRSTFLRFWYPPHTAERKELTPQETSVSTAVATVVAAQGISYLHTGAINKSDLTHPVCPAAGQNVCRWVHLTYVHAWCEVLLPYQETSFIFWRDKSVDLRISSRVKGPTPCIYLLFCSVSLVGCISIWDEALEHWEVAQPSVVCI